MTDEMEIDQETAVVISNIRRSSSLLAAFPWQTDVIVNGRKFETFFGEDDFLMPLAKRVDQVFARLDQEYDKDAFQLKELLEMSRKPAVPSRPTLINACSLLVCLRLLDVAVKTKGSRKNVDILKHEKVRYNKGSLRIWEKFGDWTRILRDCRKHVNSLSSMSSNDAELSRGNNILALLQHSIGLRKTDGAIVIIHNFLVAAASIAILVQGPKEVGKELVPEIPDRPKQFFQRMIENVLYNEDDPMDNNQDSQAMKVDSHLQHDSSKKETSYTMRSALTLSTLLSPLSVVIPVQLITTSCNKADLVMLSKSLGNDKPSSLEDVELKLWEALMTVAAGKQSPFIALKSFLDDLDWQTLDGMEDRSWFHSMKKNVQLKSYSQLEPSSEVPSDWTMADLHITSPPAIENGSQRGDASGSDPAVVEPLDGHQPAGPSNGGTEPENQPSNVDEETGSGGGNVDEQPVKPNGGLRITLLPPKPLKPPPKPKIPKQKTGIPKPNRTGKNEKEKDSDKRGQRFLTVPPAKKQYWDVIPPLPVIRAQSLKAKYIQMDIETIAGPRLKSDLLEEDRPRHPHPQNASCIAYTANGEEVEFHACLHTVDEVNMLHSFMAAATKTCTAKKPFFITKPNNSIFSLMEHTEFDGKRCEDLLMRIRDKVLIVRNGPITIPGFDEEGLTELRDLDTTVCIQDKSIPVADGDYGIQTVHGTLNELLHESRKENGKILNCLDLGMGMNSVYPTALSSETVAWRTTEGLSYCKSEDLPADHLRWALAATGGAFHGWHIDNVGAGTFISVQTGAKLFFIASPKSNNNADLNIFVKDFDPFKSNTSKWDVEAIVLKGGDTIIFPPGTVHAVYTIDPSICLGGHIYPSSTLTHSLLAHIRSFVLGGYITNTEVVLRRDIHHRIMSFIHHTMVEGHIVHASRFRAHIPIITDFRSVINILSGCALAIFTNALSRETYCYPQSQSGDEEDDEAQHYRYLEWDLNDLSALERRRSIHGRSLAWKTIFWLKARYTFHEKTTTVEVGEDEQSGPLPETNLDFYDDILVPFLGHLSLSIQDYHAKACKKDVVSANGIQKTYLKNQLTACFLYNPEIVVWTEAHKNDARNSFIYPFDIDIEVRVAEDPEPIGTGHECDGVTALDQKYYEGVACDWVVYKVQMTGADQSTQSDESEESEKSEEERDEEYVENEAPRRKKRRVL